MSRSARTCRSPFNQFFFKSRNGILLILVLSFILKVGLRLFLSNPDHFWNSGYSFYYQMAVNFLKTGELYLQNGHSLYLADKLYAVRPPLYPLFIAWIGSFSHLSVFAFVSSQAFISTLTVALVYLITTRYFNVQVARFSAALYAFYPYSFFHDTQLQENVLYNFTSLLAIWFLVMAADKKKSFLYFLMGLTLGLCVLTRVTHAVHSCFLIALVFYRFRKNMRSALIPAYLVGLGLLLTVAPWLARNKRILGSFTLTSLTGATLAEAHNEFTFLYFPYKGSMDKSTAHFRSHLKQTRWDEIKNRIGDEMAQEKWYRNMAVEYISNHKVQTLARGLYKVAVNFLGLLSPQQNPIKNWVYFFPYWLLTLLMVKSFGALKHTIFFQAFIALSISQALFSFVFWAHTSHRAFLDPMLAVCAGVGLYQLLFPNEQPVPEDKTVYDEQTF